MICLAYKFNREEMNMKRLESLQLVALYCTISNFWCIFFGIDANTVRQFINPDRTVQSELIASR
jgi:hypothetical protein